MEGETPAERQWGYSFGVDGVAFRDEACRLLGGVTDRTIRTYAAEGFVRVGYRKPGKPSSGLVVCRRSIDEFNRSRER